MNEKNSEFIDPHAVKLPAWKNKEDLVGYYLGWNTPETGLHGEPEKPEKNGKTGSDQLKGFMDVQEVARALSLSVRTIWKLSASGELPKPVRLGRSSRWSCAEIQECLQSKKKDQGGNR
jgi:predicted DNA-binding transcriptional regulator AlpA